MLSIILFFIGAPVITWSQALSSSACTSPAIGDLDGDGLSEIVIVDYSARIYCFETDGTLKWQKQMASAGQSPCHPIIANIDNSGGAEVIAGGPTIYCYDSAGVEQWSYTTGWGGFYGVGLAVANLDTIGDAEIICHKSDSLICLNSDGTQKWIAYTKGAWAAIADIDEDCIPEILKTNGDILACHSGLDGSVEWEITLSTPYAWQPAIADVDADGYAEVIVPAGTNTPGGISCVSYGGTLKWFYSLGNTQGVGQPAIADVNQDGKDEIVYYDYASQQVQAIQTNASGTAAVLVWTAPVTDGSGNSLPVPVICNMDSDNYLEVMIMGSSSLYIIDGLAGSIQYTDANFSSSTWAEHGVSVADVDNDGIVELVGILQSGIALLEDDANWASLQNTAFQSYTYHITDIESNLYVPRKEGWHWECHNTWLAQADADSCPGCGPTAIEESKNITPTAIATLNPFTDYTKIKYTVTKDNAPVLIQIYDISGTLVSTLMDERKSRGTHNINWYAKKSGVYFCIINIGGETKKIKLISTKSTVNKKSSDGT